MNLNLQEVVISFEILNKKKELLGAVAYGIVCMWNIM